MLHTAGYTTTGRVMAKTGLLKIGGLTGQPLQVFLLTYVAYVTLYCGRKPLSVAKSAMGLPTATLGNMDTAFLAAYAFGQLFLAGLSTQTSTARALALCYGGCALAMLGFAAFESDQARIMLWGANGLFQALCYPLCVRALAPHLPQASRGKLMGIWTTSQAVGGVVANSFAAAAMSRWGWRAAFAPGPATGLALAALALLLGLPQDSPPSASATSEKPTHGQVGGDAAAEGNVAVVTTTPGLPGLMLAYFAIKLTRYTLLFWLPMYLHQELGYSSPQAGFAATLFDVGAVAGSVGAGFLADRWPIKESVVVAMAGVSAPLCIMLAGTRGYTVPLMLLAGCAIAGPDSLLGGVLTQECVERSGRPERLSVALGLVNGAGSVGAILQGSFVAHMLDGSWGWAGVWDGCAMLCLVAVAALLPVVLHRQQPLLPSHSAAVQ
jgi:sugar phosphate permease